MLASIWLLLLVYPHAVQATECLVGCLVQGFDPFDDDNLFAWSDRAMCDSSTTDCEVSAINYPSASYQGALWTSTSSTDGSSACTCDICDPYPWSDTTSYMSEEESLWSRIHCFLAASEASGYDVSPCVAAIIDTGTLLCVDDVYEPPTVDQLECEGNGIRDVTDYDSSEVCNWDGDPRAAQELFSATSTSSSSTGINVVVSTKACLVGCLVQGINPFDEDGLTVWDNVGTCGSSTIDCEVSAITYPSSSYQGALWASSLDFDGSTTSSCTCSICDPHPWSVTTSYMPEETSLWSRIHCYLVSTEASGYDVSPCVAAIVDTGTLPCVDDVYEPPTVDHTDCEANGIKDLTDSSSGEECNGAGEYRSTDELYGGTRAPSTAPAPSTTHNNTPQPGIVSINSSDSAKAEGAVPCSVGSTCQDAFCCHPDTNTCGRKYTFCQQREVFDGSRCCSGVDGDHSASNVCSEGLNQEVWSVTGSKLSVIEKWGNRHADLNKEPPFRVFGEKEAP